MTYSSYLNDKELRAAADRYTEMYGGQFECADTGDVLLYRKNEGDTYISVKADYPVPLFIQAASAGHHAQIHSQFTDALVDAY